MNVYFVFPKKSVGLSNVDFSHWIYLMNKPLKDKAFICDMTF